MLGSLGDGSESTLQCPNTYRRTRGSFPREFMEDDGQEKHMESGHWYGSALQEAIILHQMFNQCYFCIDITAE